MSTALYRRYRPDSFAEVIGQEHVTEPLMTALGKDAVSHAYLFSGPRGCGKTTSARILARCLNCAQGPTGTPCGTCDSCLDLATGGSGSLDVIEIDAASHGGVDDARDLRERATFAPVRDRYKIFIIDEAHMVTAAGFNALLKIVEEPPEHIKFIFATTEPDKVIGTIRSRTHHYPFRLVPPEPLMEYLHRLCDQEGVTVAPGVLPLVIRAGGGSVRDTLSVLDQLIAGSAERTLDYDRATALLGFTHATMLDEVVQSVAALDGATAFSVVDRVVQSGQDPRRFVEDLLERLRDLIVVKSVPENPGAILRGVPEDQIRSMQTQAGQLGSAELSRAADISAQALTDMVGATSPRLHLELLMARLLLPHAEQGHASVAARLERVERRLDFAAGAGVTPDAEADTAGDDAGDAPRQSGSASSTAASSTPDASSAPEAGSGSKDRAEPQALADPKWAAPAQSAAASDPRPAAAPPGRQAGPPAGDTRQSDTPQPEGPRPEASQPHDRQPAASPAATPTPSGAGEPAAASPPASAAGGSTDEMMRRAWPDIVDSLKSQSRMLWMLVKGNVSVGGFDGQALSLDFANEGARTTFANRNGEQAMNAAIEDVLGMKVRFKLVTGGTSSAGGGGGPKADRRLSPAAAPQEAQPGDDTPAWVQEEPPEPYDPGFAEAPPEQPADQPSEHPAESNASADLATAAGSSDPDAADLDPTDPDSNDPEESAAADSRAAASSAVSPEAAAHLSSDASALKPDAGDAYRPLAEKTPVPAFARRAGTGPRWSAPADVLAAGDASPGTVSSRADPQDSAAAQDSAPAQHTAAGSAAGPPGGGAPSRAAEIRRRLAQRGGGGSPSAPPSEPPADHPSQPAPPPDPAWDSGPPSDYDQSAPPSWAQAEPEDVASEDDVPLEHSGVFGRKAFEKHLGATLLEERRLNE
ncbi:DNA polymerase III subunit gamma and tau [Nesterenkonia sp. DZ6]|uniref:DNA polymerase III subunit gamma and tau n=1 Tax=Nesterenkonia sp. DZ6 TaxID=2901229 RepID=UPI001F4D0D72|nr:DNA polymerase III subunit gamma and tau [Nesterenkonia sp. DZ6]